MASKHKLCPHCKYPNEAGSESCRLCGRPMDPDQKRTVPGVTVDPVVKEPARSKPATRPPRGRKQNEPEPPDKTELEEEAGKAAKEEPADEDLFEPESEGVAAAEPKLPAGDVPVLGSPPSPFPALLRVLDGGREGEFFRLREKVLVIGRAQGDVPFPGDALLSALHASVRSDGRLAWVRDLQSRNGTFLRCTDKVEILDGMEFLFGQTLVRFLLGSMPQARPARTLEFGEAEQHEGLRAAILRGKGRTTQEVPLENGSTIGREGQTLELSDRFVSPRHARVQVGNGKAFLTDQGSRNGTYVRIPGEKDVELRPGDMVRMGRQVFRFEVRN